MGLDSHASLCSKRVYLNDNALCAFDKQNIHLCGYNRCSFRGKLYSTIVEAITDETLYSLKTPHTLGVMAEKIRSFLEAHPQLQDDRQFDIRSYINEFDENVRSDDEFLTTYNTLVSLQRFFQVCGDHQLFLHADW